MVLGYQYFLLCGFISLVIWVPWAKRIFLLNLAVRKFLFCSNVFVLVYSSSSKADLKAVCIVVFKQFYLDLGEYP